MSAKCEQVPYLHYETHRDFQAMADTVAEAIDAWPDMSDGTTGMIKDREGLVSSKKKRPSKHTEKTGGWLTEKLEIYL